jgi:hypothetical protein
MIKMGDKIVKRRVYLNRSSKKGIFVRPFKIDVSFWLPSSQCKIVNSSTNRHTKWTTKTIELPEWLWKRNLEESLILKNLKEDV